MERSTIVRVHDEAPRVCRRLIRSNYAAIGMKSIVA